MTDTYRMERACHQIGAISGRVSSTSAENAVRSMDAFSVRPHLQRTQVTVVAPTRLARARDAAIERATPASERSAWNMLNAGQQQL
jgi:hypothetical protein